MLHHETADVKRFSADQGADAHSTPFIISDKLYSLTERKLNDGRRKSDSVSAFPCDEDKSKRLRRLNIEKAKINRNGYAA